MTDQELCNLLNSLPGCIKVPIDDEYERVRGYQLSMFIIKTNFSSHYPNGAWAIYYGSENERNNIEEDYRNQIPTLMGMNESLIEAIKEVKEKIKEVYTKQKTILDEFNELNKRRMMEIF